MIAIGALWSASWARSARICPYASRRSEAMSDVPLIVT
jgi:hypothetical protein